MGLLWAAYLIGLFLSLLLQAQTSVRSKSNGLNDTGLGLAGMLHWLQLSWVVVLVRLAFAIAIFGFISQSTRGHALLEQYNLQLAWYFVLPFGIAEDSVAEKLLYIAGNSIPALKVLNINVPQLVPPDPAVPQSTAFRDIPQSNTGAGTQ